ncbi:MULTISPECIES: YfhO family protein [unclassified Kribbella]|uniref:YfhO family protein n=1 Tax=unclassified Kribbella TaxID=2644121 RepID=UPI003017564B
MSEATPRTRFRRRWWYPIPAAAVAAAAAFVVSGIIRGTYPFGDRPRNTNDLGQQFIPMHAHLRDLLTGHASGDLLFNWSSGFGVPFLGDFMAYVGTSLSWLVLLFPRDRIDLALFVIATAAMALGAAAMTAYLRFLRPGPGWLAAAAGVSYALCGWAIDDATYMTEWLNGMIAFPVICLLCEWILRRRSIPSMIVTPFVVALLWVSHFYTVYMATLGAAIVVVARLLTYDGSWRHRLAGGLRCAIAVAIGIGLSAPLLVPTFRAVGAARPSPKSAFEPISWLDFLSRLLAGSEGVGTTPGLAVGTLMLLLAVSLPFNRAVATRERIVWTAMVVLTVVSMQVRLTHEVWHGFDSPNGSPFRQAFVIAGMLVIAGWLSLASGVRNLLAVAAPLGILAVLYFLAYDVRTVTATTHVVVPVVAAVAVLGWFLAHRRPAVSRWVRGGAAALLVGAVLVETTVSAAAIDQARAKILGASAPWGDRQDQARSLVGSALDWPGQRVSPGATTTVNDPMLIGGQGSEYYSSTIPNDLSKALLGLGFGYSSYGRATIDPKNPVVDAVFAIGARVVSDGDDPRSGELRLEKRSVGPLVSMRPGKTWTSTDPGPFGRQETALGTNVYAVPKVKAVAGPGVSVSDRRAGQMLIVTLPDAATPAEVRLTASCRAGAEIWLDAASFVGEVLIPGAGWQSVLKPNAKRPGVYTGAPMLRVGTVGTDGVVDVPLRVTGQARLRAAPIGCLEPDRLTAAIDQLNQNRPAGVDVGGHSIDVRLNPGTAGTVALGVLRIPGWRCAIDDGPARRPAEVAGVMAVRVDDKATKVSCDYRPAGARAGLAVGAAALITLVGVAGVLVLLRRRKLTTG